MRPQKENGAKTIDGALAYYRVLPHRTTQFAWFVTRCCPVLLGPLFTRWLGCDRVRAMNKLFRQTLAPDLVSRFVAIVGAKNAITDPAEQESYLIEERGLYHGRTAVVLRPGSVDEVAAILTLANEIGAPIVPQGGNTGLVGGQIPFDGEIVLSLRRLDRIREIDAVSNTMTCEAGVVLASAQEAAAAAGRVF
jgi:hypothetical protein